MSFAALLVHDVTIVTPGTTTSRYDDALKDWATATRTTVKGWVSQSSRSEVLGEREAELSTWVLYVFPDVEVTAMDRVEWFGYVFEVDGPPNHAWTPRGEHHIECALKVVEG